MAGKFLLTILKIKQVVDNEDLDIEEVMAKLDKIETKIKFEAFGKTTKKEMVSKKVKAKPNQVEDAVQAKLLIDKQSKSVEDIYIYSK